MPDDLTLNTAGGQKVVLTDQITSRNGATQTDQAHAQVIKLALGDDGIADDIGDDNPVPVREAGTFGYATDTAAGTVNVPAGARLRRVAVIPGSNGATVQIGNGEPTITVPADGDFDESIPGTCVSPTVTIGGDVESYYVAWVA